MIDDVCVYNVEIKKLKIFFFFKYIMKKIFKYIFKKHKAKLSNFLKKKCNYCKEKKILFVLY